MPIVTPEWVRDAVFYQVFPDRFARSGRVDHAGPLEPWDTPPTHHGFKGGDLYGVAERLDYLADLGVTAIYLNPVFSSASNHRYHTYDYLAVDPLLGGDDALRELLDKAHARGIRVILDGVFNHASRGFWPFNHVLECGIGSPYVDWFHIDRERARRRPVRCVPTRTSPRHAPSRRWADRFGRSSALGYKAWWNLPALPKLNTDNPKVREYLMRRRGALDPVRRRRLAPGRGRGDRRRRVLARVPPARQGGQSRRVHRGRGLDRGPPLAQGRPVRRLHELPARVRRPVVRRRLPSRRGVIAQHGDVRNGVRREDGPGFAGRLQHAVTTYDPDDQRGPAQPAGQPRHAADPHDLRRRPRRRPAGRTHPDDRRRCALHLLRRRDRHGRRPGPVLPRLLPGGRGRLGP